ncbi:hypothetical protein DXG01_007096 [Tephrocybe rancida]|nr:hypothetical protein DXG01_007096 [Tephrocybe rancida]
MVGLAVDDVQGQLKALTKIAWLASGVWTRTWASTASTTKLDASVTLCHTVFSVSSTTTTVDATRRAMNHDVDDPEKGLQDTADRKKPGRRLSTQQRPNNLLARLRSFNISSIGSAFSGPLAAMSAYVTQEGAENTNNSYDTWDYANDLEAGRTFEGSRPHQDSYYTTSTPTQTRSSSPLKTQSGRLSEVKRLFNNLARFRHADQMPPSTSLSSDSDWNTMMNAPRTLQNPPPLYAPSIYEWDDQSGTPPLTPDSFEDVNNNIPSPIVPGDYDDNLKYEYDDEESGVEWTRSRSYSREIKEGKKPDRSFDISDDLHENFPSPKKETRHHHPQAAVHDGRDEWYGLEYTLELSCRERLPSDTKSAGEHSKSRESWAAIHQGTIHPFFEDEEYYQWKNWHRYLDRQDERKRHRLGWEFKARSKDLAWFYEVYGVVARDVKERLTVLAQHRPVGTVPPTTLELADGSCDLKDPYSPPKKHNLGWYLKRSLSVGCLQEFCPRPGPKHEVRSHECVDSPMEEFSVVDDDGVLITD